MLESLLLFAAGGLVVWLSAPFLIARLRHGACLDIPNERSSHTLPVPRGGGIAIVFALLTVGMAQALLGWGNLRYLIASEVGVTFLALLGWLDDLYSLRPLTRLIVQGIVAAFCLWLADLHLESLDLPLLPPLPWTAFGWVAAWLWIVGFTNMFNFMDGIDGLAGTLAAAAGLFFVCVARAFAVPEIWPAAAVLAGASLGFLRYNLPPAKVFLGDVGSLPIGFFLAFATLRLGHDPAVSLPLLAPVLALWPLLFDATLTLLQRAVRRQPLHHAHRDHLYQRLIRSGYSHGQVTARYALAATFMALVALLYTAATDGQRTAILVAVALGSGVVATRIARLVRARTSPINAISPAESNAKSGNPPPTTPSSVDVAPDAVQVVER